MRGEQGIRGWHFSGCGYTSAAIVNVPARWPPGFAVLPRNVIVRAVSKDENAFLRVFDPKLSQRYGLASSLHHPRTFTMRELARQVRIKLGKAIAYDRMVRRMNRVTPTQLE